MLCPVSATQSAAALLHHLGRSIDRASRSRHSKFKPAVLGEIQAAGDNIRVIQVLLGHSKLETTALYTRIATNTIRAVMSPLDRLAPLMSKKDEPKDDPPA